MIKRIVTTHGQTWQIPWLKELTMDNKEDVNVDKLVFKVLSQY